MKRITGSSGGHHLLGDQPNAGTTATSAERHLKHINPHRDNYTARQRTHTHTHLYDMQWRKMRGNGYWRERESEGNERQSK